jgi:hypothetical protein
MLFIKNVLKLFPKDWHAVFPIPALPQQSSWVGVLHQNLVYIKNGGNVSKSVLEIEKQFVSFLLMVSGILVKFLLKKM